ncbi:MAG: sigma-54 interaction domain-containing protein [Bacteroidota bacterium]|jgi:transcriptional regulator with PAS, ATPase and Fis domain
MSIQEIKQRFGIIGNNPELERALHVAMQVANTDLSVLVTGESGTGKEVFPQIIHHLSSRKHGPYIAVNCGAIPEGTIDSELFGHEKGSFTGAIDARKGYFEVVNGGTIFLDEVAELPIHTQARLLRVLESGEFIKVGSSKVQKTDVRIIAATNVNIADAIEKNRFREDLYYRLNTIPIRIPALRNRHGDISLLFRKFSADFASRYRMPGIRLNAEAQQLLENYHFPGNIRQLKNLTEQISIIETQRDITPEILRNYLPAEQKLPVLLGKERPENEFTERDILYKVLFEMRKELFDLKKIVADLMGGAAPVAGSDEMQAVSTFFNPHDGLIMDNGSLTPMAGFHRPTIEVEESLSIEEKEKSLIRKALEKHKGKRKKAARELGISERTLYRKINEYGIR